MTAIPNEEPEPLWPPIIEAFDRLRAEWKSRLRLDDMQAAGQAALLLEDLNIVENLYRQRKHQEAREYAVEIPPFLKKRTRHGRPD